MLKSVLCDYSNEYILLKETIAAVGQGKNNSAIRVNRNTKKIISKNCASLTDCISEISNTQINQVEVERPS